MVPHAEETRQIEREPFSVVFYGLRTFDCKIAQFYAMLHESEMTETPGVSNTVQVGENARKTPPLNYESAALPAELRGRSVIHVILGDVLTSVLTSAVTVRFLNARFTYETVIEYGGKGIRTPDFQLAKLALYQLSYAPRKELRNVVCRLQIAIIASHQILARCSGGTNILSVGWTLKASYQTSVFRVGPITRN